jgi:hypothetical protein
MQRTYKSICRVSILLKSLNLMKSSSSNQASAPVLLSRVRTLLMIIVGLIDAQVVSHAHDLMRDTWRRLFCQSGRSGLADREWILWPILNEGIPPASHKMTQV